MKFSLKKDGPEDIDIRYKAFKQKVEVRFKEEMILVLNQMEKMSRGKKIKLPTGDDLFVQMRGEYFYVKLNGKIMPESVFDPNYLEDKRRPRRKLILVLFLIQITVAVLMYLNIVPTKFSKAIIQQLIALPIVTFIGFFYFWVIKKGGSLIPYLSAIGLYIYYFFMFEAGLGLVFNNHILSSLYLDLLPLVVVWCMSSYCGIDTPLKALYDKS